MLVIFIQILKKMSSPKFLAPIVLFVYNRPWHTSETINSLKQNFLAKKSDLFIFSDGAKTSHQVKNVLEVRRIIKQVKGFKSVKVIEQKNNIGLASSIINGVTDVINQYQKVIVMEDDMVTSPHFLSFMNDALHFYEPYEKVMHISGYMYPVDNKNLSNTFFLKLGTCWGWATWKRAWKHFKKDTDFLIDTFDNKMIYDFNLDDAYDYFSQVKNNKLGKINTWAIYWYATIYLQDGLSLHPSSSFVKNIGHDGYGEHCVKSNTYDVELCMEYPIKFSNKLVEDVLARKVLRVFYKTRKISYVNRVARKLKGILNTLGL